MGEYERLNKMLADDQRSIAVIDTELTFVKDPKVRKLLLEQKYDLQIGIGEIKGALLEMAQLDGLDDPYEAFDYTEV